ncbi:MAG: hypothetical protein ACLQBX_07725 [Candidatus Limnocylindrales bacterium]|jgi:hypothetical protein
MQASHSTAPTDSRRSSNDAHPVADAGLLLPATLPHPFDLKALLERYHDLGADPDELA